MKKWRVSHAIAWKGIPNELWSRPFTFSKNPCGKELNLKPALAAEVDALKRLQAETATELNALLPTILDNAFEGEP